MKILLVEDNELNRDMLTRRLQRQGIVVCPAEDGIQGLELASREKPDIVLLDLSLPRLDGWEFARRMRQNPKTAHIPILALTAHVLAEELERALEAGVDDALTKPILDFSLLLEKIQTLTHTTTLK